MFRQLKHCLSSEDFKSSNERVQTDLRQKANLLYRRPANQKESDSSMTFKAHGTFDASRVSGFKEVGDNSLITFCHMKQLTPLHFQCFKLIILSGQVFHALLTNEHSLTYNQIDCLALFFET